MNSSSKDGSRALVVGGAGFLGRALSRALQARGYRVRALDRRPNPLPIAGVEELVADLRDAPAVRAAVSGCQAVFHTAAVINLLGVCAAATRQEVFAINLGGTLNVIRASQASGVRRLVYTSTNSVCYRPGPVVAADETLPYASRFLDIYAESKAAAERAVLAADQPGGLRTVALRPAGLWGAGPGCYMLDKFIDELARGALVATVGDGRSLSDNTHVDNLVQAELLADEKLASAPGQVGGQAYFITDEEPQNLMAWFQPLVEALGYRMPRLAVPAALMYRAAYLLEWLHRLGGPWPAMTRLEVHNLTSSFTFRTDKARRELGYRPLIGRDQGLTACLPYCRERLAERRQAQGVA